jgi:hypothetical protein
LDARGIYAKVRETVESFEEWQQAGKKRLKVVR